MKRMVIIGNSGSGKTFLAKRLGEATGIPVIHLDDIFWEPGGFNRKRAAVEMEAEIAAGVTGDEWIVEGVFGDLAEKFLPRATHLVWLDLPWEACRDSLSERGSESSRQVDPERAKENFAKLMVWAEGYGERDGSCSEVGHRRIFESFGGEKWRIGERMEMEMLVARGWVLPKPPDDDC